MQVNVDGEPMVDTKFSFKVLPKRLRLHVPEPRLLEAASESDSEAGKCYLVCCHTLWLLHGVLEQGTSQQGQN